MADLERELRRMEARLRIDLRGELDERIGELRRHVDSELEQLTRRVDTVHRRALTALTDHHSKGGTA